MPRYSEEFKAKVVEKMMPPNARKVADVRQETGVSEPTLYAWRRELQNRGHAVPADTLRTAASGLPDWTTRRGVHG